MSAIPYQQRRGELETYFDRTAADAWARLTSDAPVSGIRRTVRAGRDAMRGVLLGWLPADLRGRRLLDAGCGTGALSVEAARRGAAVVAVDLAGTLLDLARERAPGGIEFRVGDMLDPALGRFDHVAAMDSLIHYPAREIARMLGELASRTERSMVATFVPRTPALAAMHAVGRLFPRGDRAPSVEPVGEAALRRLIEGEPLLRAWRVARTQRIATGFYISQALELVPR